MNAADYSKHSYARHLTNEALAERLRLMADSPRRWPIADRGYLCYEAARRLDAASHDIQESGFTSHGPDWP